MNKNTATLGCILTLVAVLIAYAVVHPVLAAPTGAQITFNSTAGTPSSTASNRTDPRSTITTVVLSSVQQDQYWKAYVGNVTGRLSLDDANSFTIYDWPISLQKDGEVYLSRHVSPVWNVSCANIGNITQEHGYYGMTGGQSDNINKTFNATNHQQFFVGSQQINANTCRSTATFRNDAAQALNGNQIFQEILLQDTSDNLIYTTIINASMAGYDNNPYDFQIIIPESLTNTSTTYYFFTELG